MKPMLGAIILVMLLVVSSGAQEGFFKAGDQDGSGTWSEEEYASMFGHNEALENKFSQFDIDDDRRISPSEFEIIWIKHWEDIAEEGMQN